MNRIVAAIFFLGLEIHCGLAFARYIEADPAGIFPAVAPAVPSPTPRPLTAADVLRFHQLNHSYLYVYGNPLSRTDPLGLIPIGSIPNDPNQPAIFYNFAITRPASNCSCPPSMPPTMPLTPGQAIGGSTALGAGIGAAAGLGYGLAITGAEMGEAAGLLGAAGAAAVAGKTAVTGAAIGGAAGAVAGVAFAGLIVVSAASSNSCPVQCPPCP